MDYLSNYLFVYLKHMRIQVTFIVYEPTKLYSTYQFSLEQQYNKLPDIFLKHVFYCEKGNTQIGLIIE